MGKDDLDFRHFSGFSAGCGSMWHWYDYLYLNNLWYHFQRFNNVANAMNPIVEKYEPIYCFEQGGVRCFALKGLHHTVIWCRDTANNWKTELVDGIAAQDKNHFHLNLASLGSGAYSSYYTYHLWEDYWSSSTSISGQNITLENSFKRSVVIFLNNYAMNWIGNFGEGIPLLMFPC